MTLFRGQKLQNHQLVHEFARFHGQMCHFALRIHENGRFHGQRTEIDGAGQKIEPFLGREWLNDCSVHKNGRFYGQSGGIDGVVHEKGCFHG